MSARTRGHGGRGRKYGLKGNKNQKKSGKGVRALLNKLKKKQ